MKVYLGFFCSYDFCNTHEQVQAIFVDELKAMKWVTEFEPVKHDGTEVEWREYREHTVNQDE